MKKRRKAKAKITKKRKTKIKAKKHHRRTRKNEADVSGMQHVLQDHGDPVPGD